MYATISTVCRLTLWLLLFTMPMLHAAESDKPAPEPSVSGDTPRPADETRGQPDGETPQNPAAAERNRKQADIFVPSEEISEDFAVSFPVDI